MSLAYRAVQHDAAAQLGEVWPPCSGKTTADAPAHARLHPHFTCRTTVHISCPRTRAPSLHPPVSFIVQRGCLWCRLLLVPAAVCPCHQVKQPLSAVIDNAIVLLHRTCLGAPAGGEVGWHMPACMQGGPSSSVQTAGLGAGADHTWKIACTAGYLQLWTDARMLV